MQSKKDNSSTGVFPAACMLLCLFLISFGCNQQRYKPAKWRAAARNTTLPDNETTTANGARWNSLPMTRGGTLPWRSAGGSTLPSRGVGGTLPLRNWSTLPGGRGVTTLPQRDGGRWEFPLPNGSTLPNRGRVGGVNTLPQRQTYPENRMPRGNWTTLPRAGDR